MIYLFEKIHSIDASISSVLEAFFVYSHSNNFAIAFITTTTPSTNSSKPSIVNENKKVFLIYFSLSIFHFIKIR